MPAAIIKNFDARKYALVDLHLHLDGSLSMADAIHMAAVEGVSLPAERSAVERLLACPESCGSLNDYTQGEEAVNNLYQQYTMLKNAIREMGGYEADEEID